MKNRPVAVLLVLALLGAGALVLVDRDTSRAEYGDITLNRHAEKAGMPPVVFPHWFHRIRFKCKVCHRHHDEEDRQQAVLRPVPQRHHLVAAAVLRPVPRRQERHHDPQGPRIREIGRVL